MSPSEFCYWLQGFFEITGTHELTPEQCKMVKEHLSYVFETKGSKSSLDSLVTGAFPTRDIKIC